MTASTNVKYDFDPALPSPGEDYDKFEERLLNAGSGQTDDRGYSLAARQIASAPTKAELNSRPKGRYKPCNGPDVLVIHPFLVQNPLSESSSALAQISEQALKAMARTQR